MNEFAGYAVPKRGGWWAMLRFARDGKPKPLMEGGKPQVFPDELAATKAALRHTLAYFNGHLVCSGEIQGTSIKAVRFATAEKLFLGSNRSIEVTRTAKRGERA